MSNFRVLVLLSLFVSLLLCVPFVCSVDPPVTAPSPPPESGADIASPPSNASSPSPLSSPSFSPSPSPSQSLNSPPAPPPSDSAPGSAPTPTTPAPSNVPAPAPSDASDVSHAADAGNMKADEHSSGMSSGKKVGIAFGVVLGVCAVGLGALVYKKRQQNIRRSEFGYATRDML